MSKTTVKSNGTATIATFEHDPEYGPMIALRQSRKGAPANEDRFPFRFGPGKARLLLAHIAELQKFVADNPAK